ncbi:MULTISPECIES: cadmium resistance transporter [unclassified Tolypothrix]|uniref:cadmium resistance transporter n=1 Tax=unclassified Tolypothrix TaxID=2649714 RepID=UPI0005EAA38B|nr:MULTISPECIES: cadmium resistance transporter [unclassified Tolypothrix]BAY89948.1 cadmium resistance transporter [Microchaete diplosiphon NIES-3275]EKE96995.1 cadmium resistance transporter [Tolypothrix sp. PCC 7601]MBE9085181.1 cadmium resistance transporter [Tolypothrix sp. LEGE 11397]UYD24180.1 cadmium resistance transporter [Tolypothrix sp. PCC 7712]UYD33591.1 cadmium resistance transporter [Tolypothrix sp. PCC 7601]
MNWLIGTSLIGISAAIATTFDDNIYLTAFFGKVNHTFRPKHIILGEFVGFTVLVIASLPGFFGGLVLPEAWVGLLGILPITIGISNLMSREDDGETVQDVSLDFRHAVKSRRQKKSLLATLRDPQTYRVSAVTIANGGNNIGIYVPLFASTNLPSLGVILCVCYITVGLWCLLSYNLTRNPWMAPILNHYGRKIFPFILIWLGISIMSKSGTFQLIPSFATLFH